MKHVIYLSDKNKFASKEELYYKVRQLENRIYPDAVVETLPNIYDNSPYYEEWRIRREDFNKLKKYLTKKDKTLNIVDIGSGNCWMADKLTQINNSTVTALDLNEYELEQGARVFSKNNNLKICYGDIFSLTNDEKFDVIVLAASIQYFKNLGGLIEKLLSLLKKEGEIHIIDSLFYKKEELEGAKKRSDDYYTKLGVPEMAVFYYHHSFDEFNGLKPKIRKTNIFDRLFLRITKKQKVFFAWIIIKSKI